jgi:hypothetical protein
MMPLVIISPPFAKSQISANALVVAASSIFVILYRATKLQLEQLKEVVAPVEVKG